MDEDHGGPEVTTDTARSGRWSRRTVIASVAGVIGIGAGAFLLSALTADQTATGTEDRRRFKNLHSGKYLEVTGGRIENGATVHQWEETGNENQYWASESTTD